MAKGDKYQNKIIGGTFSGKTNVVAGKLVDRGPAVQIDRLEDLRAALELHRGDLVRAGGAEGEQVRQRLDRLDGKLAEDEPKAASVRKSWKAVVAALTGAAAAAESVKKISELVHAAFP